MMGLNRGNSWSIHFDGEEGNKIAVYLDTPVPIPQPYDEALNLDQSDVELLAETKCLSLHEQGTWQMLPSWFR
ncbi:MAG: hypothetical protein EPO08_06935 [Rhodospirillaceae bacterium]|nr:MAG: hypothetical protein EPO08_06935 [Rhodospirillaceae bacterium]